MDLIRLHHYNGEDYCFCHSYYSVFFLSFFLTKSIGQTCNIYRYGPLVDLITLTHFQGFQTFQGYRPIFDPKTEKLKSI